MTGDTYYLDVETGSKAGTFPGEFRVEICMYRVAKSICVFYLLIYLLIYLFTYLLKSKDMVIEFSPLDLECSSLKEDTS